MSRRTMTLALILGAAAAVSAAPPPPTGTVAPGNATTASGASASPSTSVMGPAAGAPLTPEQVKAVDLGLGQAETIVLDAESIAKGGVDGSGCPPSLSVRDYMQDIKGRRLSKETGDDILDSDDAHKDDGGAKIEWQLYYLCQALAMKNPAACAEAGSVTPKTLKKNVTYQDGLQNPNAITNDQALAMQSSQSYEGKCTKAYYQERARSAYLAKAPNFLEACRQAVPQMAESKDAPSIERMCRAWSDFNGDPAPFIAAIQAGVAHPLKHEYALDVVREMTVQPGACAKVAHEYFRRTCREEEDFRKALAAGNKGACRGGICRVLMGETSAACEPYARKFRSSACTQRYAKEFVSTRGLAFKTYTDQAEKVLNGSDAGMGDPKALKEFNARLDKLYDLRERFDRAAEKINPGSAKKEPSARKKGT